MSGRLISKGVSISSVYDGKAVELVLSPDTMLYTADSTGKITSAQSFTINATMLIDGQSVSGFTLTHDSLPDGITNPSGTATSLSFQIPSSLTAGKSGSFVITASKTLDGVSYTAKASVKYSPNKQGSQGPDGYGYKAVVHRDNSFTEAQWNTNPGYGVINHTETWSSTSSIRNGSRTGDWFLVVGKASDTGYYHEATYECTNSSGDLSGKCISHQITKDGTSGAPGHTGRWYYYAGEYSSPASQYKMEATQSPYVKYGTYDNGKPKFWMLDFKGVEPSSFPAEAQNAPSTASTSSWTLMSAEQQYYIAEAYFGSYAHLGSFIINGDWMISQNGTYRGVSSNAYTYFDPQSPTGTKSISVQHGTIGTSWKVVGDPITALSLGHRVIRVTGKVVSGSTLTITLYNMGSATSATKTITSTSDTTVYLEIDVTDSSYNDYDVRAKMASGTGEVSVVELVSFAPTFAVDGKNGTTYQNNAQIKGTVYATNGEFSGRLNAATGSFKGSLDAATGTFKGALQAASGSFAGQLTANILYSKAKWITAATHTINVGNDESNLYYVVDKNHSITLPDAGSYSGLILRFLSLCAPVSGTSEYGIKLLSTTQNIVTKGGWGELVHTYQTVHIINYKVTSLVAVGGQWYLLEGEIRSTAEQFTI